MSVNWFFVHCRWSFIIESDSARIENSVVKKQKKSAIEQVTSAIVIQINGKTTFLCTCEMTNWILNP